MAGVSRQTVHEWLCRFRDERLAGLQDRPSVAQRCPHRTPEETEATVLALRAEIRRGPHAQWLGAGSVLTEVSIGWPLS